MFDLWVPSTLNRGVKAHKVKRSQTAVPALKSKRAALEARMVGNRVGPMVDREMDEDDNIYISALFVGQDDV